MKSFKNLNSGLTLQEIIPLGKYLNCRVVDTVDLDPEYLEWVIKNKILTLSPEVRKAVKDVIDKRLADRHYIEEVKPYLEQDKIDFEDVPF